MEVELEKRSSRRYFCRIPAKISLLVWGEEKEIVEIPGQIVNISFEGLSLEIRDENPYKSKYSSYLWERILCQEIVSLDICLEKKQPGVKVHGVMTWHSTGELDHDFKDCSEDTPEKPLDYNLGFRFDSLDEDSLKRIEVFVNK